MRFVAFVIILAGFVVSAQGLERLNTWYLSSDQFAFLTLAQDLRQGQVTREDFLYDFMPSKEQRGYDAYSQTYRLREGTLHSRYPPGFSALLAVTGILFGEVGEHWLNPFLYLCVATALIALSLSLVRPLGEVEALATGAATVWLLLLIPTDVHLWGITVARDLLAHLLALLVLLAAIGRRFWTAGFLLGLACVVRPDALLYGVSLALIAVVHRSVFPALVRGGFGFALGVVPLLVYNAVTLGNPFSFTQGTEILYFLSLIPTPVSVAHAADFIAPAGGGFRMAHLGETLRGNLLVLGRSFGWLLIPTLVGCLYALTRLRLLAAALVPYALIATVFYGFWSHPDPRYLVGVALCLQILAAFGMVLACRQVAAPDSSRWWRWGAVLVLALALARAWLPGRFWMQTPAPSSLALIVLGVTALLGLLSQARAVVERLRTLAPMAVPLLLMAVACWEVAGSEKVRDPYQQEQIARAREVIAEVIPPGSVLVTTPALGRPAENITHYTDVRAVYSSELQMLAAQPNHLPIFHKSQGRRVFFLFPPFHRSYLDSLPSYLETRVVKRIRADETLDWLLNPSRARMGATLYEVEFSDSYAPIIEAQRILAEAGEEQGGGSSTVP